MNEGVKAVLCVLPPLARQLASGLVKDLKEDSEIATLGNLLLTMAQSKNMSPEEFIRSGELLSTVKTLTGINDDLVKQRTLQMQKCPKCNHITYEVIK